MSTNEYELRKIETSVLKVNMNCQGCVNKIRKILRKIEGVYEVDINAEEQKVIVTGIVNPSTLVKKLAKLGKQAEILSAGYNQEQANHDEGKNNEEEYMINDPSAFENQYMIPTFFGKDHWGTEWCFNQDMGAKTISDINQPLAAPEPLFFESVNKTNQNFTRINENPKWQESVIPMMWPASFQENSGTHFSGLGSQEWAHNLLGVPSISEYGHQPFLTANMHRYYHNCHPSNIMQLSSYSHAPQGTNIHMQETPTRNDVMMNAYMHQHMINQKYFSLPFNFYSYYGLEIA